MRNVTTTTITALALFLSGVAFGSGLDGNPGGTQQDTLNQYNDSGQKTGYWIVTGLMKPDKVDYTEQNKIEEGGYTVNRRIGLWKNYWPNQKTKSEIEYKNGRPIGDYTVYYENGNVEEAGNWAGRKQIGNFLRNHENGEPAQRFVFNETGKRDGEQLYFDTEGNMIMKVQIANGKENGAMERYWADGTLRERVLFNNGVADESSREKHEAENPDMIVEVELQPISDETAPVVGETDKKEGIKWGQFNANGYNKLFNKNRQIWQDGQFKGGKLDNGKLYNYDKDSNLLIDVDIYKNGVPVGKGVIDETEQ
jgi:antitoxin component YwqK of YwqJK toxin-antitoxin module